MTALEIDDSTARDTLICRGRWEKGQVIIAELGECMAFD
jgi:hypothetical protein